MATAIAGGGQFRPACVASFADEILTINNNGFGLLAISDITSSSADFLAPGVSAYPLLVSVGSSIDVVLRFLPVSAGAKTATIQIISNDAASPHSITVSGNAVTPKLDAAIAGAGDFGAACVGGFVDEALALSNGRQCNLSITGISSSSAEFQTPEVLPIRSPSRRAPRSRFPSALRLSASAPNPRPSRWKVMIPPVRGRFRSLAMRRLAGWR